MPALLKHWGQTDITVGFGPYPKSVGAQHATMTLEAYVRNVTEFDRHYTDTLGVDLAEQEVPLYAFLSNFFTGGEVKDDPVMRDTAANLGVAHKEVLAAFLVQSIQLYIGPRGSGAGVHYHMDALNLMATGKKHWYLFPPAHARYTAKPAAAWRQEQTRMDEALQNNRSARVPRFECVQHTGDVLFVPEMWGHATHNEAFSVGVALEMIM